MAFLLNLYGFAIEDLLHDPDGPVGGLLDELAVRMTARAKGFAPVQGPKSYSWSLHGSTSYMPWAGGFTKSRTHVHMASIDGAGHLFAGTNAPYAPTVWLEGARDRKPFLSMALSAASV
jgi:hypothetical protein